MIGIFQAFSSVIFTYTPNHLHLTAAAMVVFGNLAFFWKPVLSSEDLKWVIVIVMMVMMVMTVTVIGETGKKIRRGPG